MNGSHQDRPREVQTRFAVKAGICVIGSCILFVVVMSYTKHIRSGSQAAPGTQDVAAGPEVRDAPPASGRVEVTAQPPVSPTSARESWTACINARDFDQIKAIESEIMSRPSEHLAWLCKVLDGRGALTDMQEFAAGLLARIGTPEAIRAIMSRYEASVAAGNGLGNLISVLGNVRNPEAAGVLADYASRCRDAGLYAAIVQAAGRCADSSFVETLSGRILHPADSREHLVSENILREIPSSRVAENFQLIVRDVTNRAALAFVANKLGDDGSLRSVETIVGELRSATGERRTLLLDGLFRVHSVEALQYLEQAVLNETDRDIRKYAIYALANFSLDAVNPTFQRLGGDPRAADMQKELGFVQGLLTKQQTRTAVR